MIDFGYGLFVLLLILRSRVAIRYRDWALRISANAFVQSALFSPLLLLTIAVLQLPLDIYGHHISLAYGLSIEGWGAWTWDWAKGILVVCVLGIVLVWILYVIIRESPRRWWFYCGLISIPILVFLTLVEPLVLEPIFFDSSRWTNKVPNSSRKSNVSFNTPESSIPPSRMFGWRPAIRHPP